MGSLKKDIVKGICDQMWQFHNDRLADPSITEMKPYVQPIINVIESVTNEIIDVCRLEYIANANTPLKDRLNASQMALHIKEKQRDIKSKLIGKE